MIAYSPDLGTTGGGIYVPEITTDTAALMEAIDYLRSGAKSLNSGAEAADSTWRGLPAVYSANGIDPLYSQLAAPVARADAIGTTLNQAAEVLSDFAANLDRLKSLRQPLVDRARWAYTAYVTRPDDPGLAKEAEDGLDAAADEVKAFVGQVREVEETCADGLARIRGGLALGYAMPSPGATPTPYSDVLAAAVNEADPVLDDLAILATMTPEEAANWIQNNPDVVQRLATYPPEIADVKAWWAGLSSGGDGAARAAAVVAAMPGALGNLNGIPYAVRNDANVLVLENEYEASAAEVAALEKERLEGPPLWMSGGQVGTGPEERLKAAEDELAALEAIRAALQSDGTRQLTEFHPGTNPLGAISVGDMDSATNIGVVVPGINSDANEFDDYLKSSGELRDEMQRLDPSGQSAVLMWIGYDSPSAFTVQETSFAEAGAPALRQTLDGISGTRPDAFLTLVGHSYGTLLASLALADGSHGVDALVMLASAGLATDDISDIQLPPQAIFAGHAPDDWVAMLGRTFISQHQTDPLDGDFGAREFVVEHSGQVFIEPHNFAAYMDSYGLRNTAAIALNDLDAVTFGRGEYRRPWHACVETESGGEFCGFIGPPEPTP